MEIRTLKANEIMPKAESVFTSGEKTYVKLLLHQNNSVLTDLLNESCGVLGWQEKTEICGDVIVKSLGIRSENGEWIWKSDVGERASMDFAGKQDFKAAATDALKRAAMKFGFCRELWTSPPVVIAADTVSMSNGKCVSRFVCSDIGYDENRKVSRLKILNAETGATVFELGRSSASVPSSPQSAGPDNTEHGAPLSPVQDNTAKNYTRRNPLPDKAPDAAKEQPAKNRAALPSYIKTLENAYDYIIQSGSYKGKTIREAMRIKPDYIGYCANKSTGELGEVCRFITGSES